MDPSPSNSYVSMDTTVCEQTEEGVTPFTVQHRKSQRPASQRMWDVFGRRVPRSEIVFFCQTFIIYIVVVTSLVNITLQNGPLNLWIALLGSGLGYLLPHPSLDKSQRHHDVSDFTQ